jgi:hypothetical protein
MADLAWHLEPELPDALQRIKQFLRDERFHETARGMPPDTGTEHIGFRCVRSPNSAGVHDGEK